MVSCFISRLVILVFGTLYPAYASYKAVRTKNVKEYVKWMMYWIVFALFTCAETFTDLFLSFWFPFYYEIKIITVIYLLSPATKGSSILYRKFVHPALIKKEQEIDEYIAKAKEQGYHTMLNLGSKGVTYATSLIMQTAIKSGGGLVNQLRRSYSLSDLSEDQTFRETKEGVTNSIDSPYDKDPRTIRRTLVPSPRKTISSIDQADLYFPETEICQRFEDGINHREVLSCEQISSGYSSDDPFYYSVQRPNGEPLVRTESLGPSSRIRTRAATRSGLPKRAGLSEGGSTWSALEAHESQNETDKYCLNIPLSHSASFPLVFPSLSRQAVPEYPYVFSKVPQNQIFTFINHSNYSEFLNNKRGVRENNFEEFLKYETSESSDNRLIILKKYLDNCISQCNEEENESKFSDFVSNSAKYDKENYEESQDEKNIREINLEMNGNRYHSAIETQNKNSDMVASQNDNVDNKENPSQERSRRSKKKPAPIPRGEKSNFKITSNLIVEDEELEYFTPNASPKPSRREPNPSFTNLEAEKNSAYYEPEVTKHQVNNLSEVNRKSKYKTKKGDFNFQKKLHIPKMTFSFWLQRSGKQPSVPEISSVESVKMLPTKGENKK